MNPFSEGLEQNIVILWGAGTGATNWLKRFQSPDVRYIIVDQSSHKHGSTHAGCLVVAPTRLQELSPQRVVITVSDVEDPLEFLRSVGFDQERIDIPAKSTLSDDAFFNKKDAEDALEWTQTFLNDCENAGFEPMVEYGALLGLVRSGELIPWDNDLDVSFPVEQRLELLSFLREWAGKNCSSESESENWSRETVESVSVRDDTKKYFLDVFFRWDINDGLSMSTMASPGSGVIARSILYPRRALSGRWGFMGPNQPVEYLSAMYGSAWRIPRRDFTFQDYLIPEK